MKSACLRELRSLQSWKRSYEIPIHVTLYVSISLPRMSVDSFCASRLTWTVPWKGCWSMTSLWIEIVSPAWFRLLQLNQMLLRCCLFQNFQGRDHKARFSWHFYVFLFSNLSFIYFIYLALTAQTATTWAGRNGKNSVTIEKIVREVFPWAPFRI